MTESPKDRSVRRLANTTNWILQAAIAMAIGAVVLFVVLWVFV